MVLRVSGEYKADGEDPDMGHGDRTIQIGLKQSEWGSCTGPCMMAARAISH